MIDANASDSYLRPIGRAVLLITVVLLSFSHVASGQTWNQVWSDEFNGAAGSSIDSSKWQFEKGNLGVNNELEFYCAPNDASPCDPSKPNAYIDGSGHLQIQAIRVSQLTSPGSNAWTSARLNTGNKLASFQYGRIEASMKLPYGAGIWPAFWALGDNVGSVGWPSCGEIDFMENVPASGGVGPNAIRSTIHGPGYSGSNGIGQGYTFPNNGDVSSFHTYGAIWSPYMVQFYVDDPSNVFFIRTANDIPAGTQWAYNHPFFLLLNLAVGGTGSWPGAPDATTPDPAVMSVDYVRVYQASSIAPPAIASPSPITIKAGSARSTTLNLTSSAGSGRVYLDCSTATAALNCSIQTGNTLNGAVVDFTSSSTAAATLTVTAGAKTASKHDSRSLGFLALLGTFLCGSCLISNKRKNRWLTGFVLVLAFTSMAASCGGASDGSTPPGRTVAGQYQVTVNAFTESSDPQNPSTYSSVQVPVTVN